MNKFSRFMLLCFYFASTTILGMHPLKKLALLNHKVHTLNTIVQRRSKSAQKPITEILQIKKILDYMHPSDNKDETLFLFDIDNTIAKSSQLIGSSEYYHHITHQLRDKLNISGLSACCLFNPLYNCIQLHVPLELVEPDALKTIHVLQNNNYPVLGFTMRNLELAQRTLTQLQALTIDFKKTTVFDIPELFFQTVTPALYHSGVIFCNGNNKGKTLKALFKLFNYTPKKIIFIDDEKRHIEAVEQACKEMGIEIECLWYRHINTLDSATLNLEQAAREMEELCKYAPEVGKLYEETIGNILK